MIEPVYSSHFSSSPPPVVPVAFTWLHSHVSDVSLDALLLVADILKEIKSTFWSKRPRNVRETKTERTAMCTEEAK